MSAAASASPEASTSDSPPADSPPPPPSGEDESYTRRLLRELETSRTASYGEYIQLLEKHRKKCVADGDYKEASLAQEALLQFRTQEEREHRQLLRDRQDMEKHGVEEAHLDEYRHFCELWDAKIRESEEHTTDMERTMKERHLAEYRQFHTEARQNMSPIAKFSKRLLDLRSVERSLAKQDKYPQAQKVKAEADLLEQEEIEAHRLKREDVIGKKEAVLLQRQRNEVEVLRQRIERWRKELEAQRTADLERIMRRYANVRKGLSAAQNIEKARTDVFLANHAASLLVRSGQFKKAEDDERQISASGSSVGGPSPSRARESSASVYGSSGTEPPASASRQSRRGHARRRRSLSTLHR